MNMINTIGLFLALWIGIASILAGWHTVQTYYPRARQFFADHAHRGFTGWLIFGVVLGIGGASIGNAYWQFYWILEHYGAPRYEAVRDYGVWINAVFRNGFLLLSSYCFCRAYLIASPDSHEREGTKFFVTTIGFGLIAAIAILGLPHLVM